MQIRKKKSSAYIYIHMESGKMAQMSLFAGRNTDEEAENKLLDKPGEREGEMN